VGEQGALGFAPEKGKAGDGVEGKDKAEKNRLALCSRAKNEEGERGRRRVNEETRALIFGQNFHPRFEGLEM
jgi:hypothetical protein